MNWALGCAGAPLLLVGARGFSPVLRSRNPRAAVTAPALAADQGPPRPRLKVRARRRTLAAGLLGLIKSLVAAAQAELRRLEIDRSVKLTERHHLKGLRPQATGAGLCEPLCDQPQEALAATARQAPPEPLPADPPGFPALIGRLEARATADERLKPQVDALEDVRRPVAQAVEQRPRASRPLRAARARRLAVQLRLSDRDPLLLAQIETPAAIG